MEKTKTQFKGVIMLISAAFIWGIAFVAQSVGMEKIEGFTFSGIRTLIGAAVLLPIIFIRDKKEKRTMDAEQLAIKKAADKKTILYGLVLGVVFCAAINFQQFAFNYSSSGKIAFITAFYMFFVPLFGLVLKKRVPIITWICVIFGVVGLYFLCIDPNDLSSINKGDILTIVCSVMYAIQILMIEKFTADVDGVKLSCIEYIVGGVLSCILMFIFEEPEIESILNAAVPLLYAGVMSCGVAFTFQIIGQKYTEATVASLIMCTESVFGALAGAIILKEVLTGREIFGCAIMFIAIILSQVSEVLTQKLRSRNK